MAKDAEGNEIVTTEDPEVTDSGSTETTPGDDAGNVGGGTALGGEDSTDEGGTDDTALGKSSGDDAQGTEGDDDGVEGAPEEYTDFNLPENIEISDKDLEEFTSLAKESNLTQGAAQKMVDIMSNRVDTGMKELDNAFNAEVKVWQDEAKSDSEIGGVKYQESVDTALKAIRKYGTPELVNMLNATKMGDHPEMIRVFNKIGKTISEDDITDGGLPSDGNEEETLGDSFYGKGAYKDPNAEK